MNCEKVSEHIVEWLHLKALQAHKSGFSVGISGGIDSALVSTLCAKTSMDVLCVSMPISQAGDQLNRAHDHFAWLRNQWDNVITEEIDLSPAFIAFEASIPKNMKSNLASVNSRSRIRMMALYAIANSKNLLVAGTGNKVEDFGIGFFTKFGDGGVDLSPVGDLTKTEVYMLAKYLNIIPSILTAAPTDGLWEDNRSDEDQIGDTYADLEIAMEFCDRCGIATVAQYDTMIKAGFSSLPKIQEKTIYNYLKRHDNNKHKMEMPPICHVEKLLKSS